MHRPTVSSAFTQSIVTAGTVELENDGRPHTAVLEQLADAPSPFITLKSSSSSAIAMILDENGSQASSTTFGTRKRRFEDSCVQCSSLGPALHEHECSAKYCQPCLEVMIHRADEYCVECSTHRQPRFETQIDDESNDLVSDLLRAVLEVNMTKRLQRRASVS